MGTNFKRKRNLLLNADVVSPDITYATFSDDLIQTVKDEIVSTLNHGGRFLEIYSQYRDRLHIHSVSKMILQLEEEYQEYSKEIFTARRRSDDES